MTHWFQLFVDPEDRGARLWRVPKYDVLVRRICVIARFSLLYWLEAFEDQQLSPAAKEDHNPDRVRKVSAMLNGVWRNCKHTSPREGSCPN